MGLTDKLLELDPTLKRYNEGNWNGPYHPGPGFSSFNDAGLECETGEFLYALARLLQPNNILETGTHWGIGMAYMGLALKENKKGHLDTIEYLREIYERACVRKSVLMLEEYVTCHFGDVRLFEPKTNYQLILIDTEPQTRFEELIKFYPFLDPGGFVFIHDLHRHMHQIANEEHGFAWPYGPLPARISEMVQNHELLPFHFTTPRGLTGFYKSKDEDFFIKSGHLPTKKPVAFTGY